MNYIDKLQSVSIRIPEILLPKADTDLTKFSVVACDQYSQDKEYWKRVEDFVGDAPSTLNMMMPEAWLNLPEKKVHEERIPQVMEKLMADGTLVSPGKGLVFLKRTTTAGVRKGLVVALDLEDYDYTPGSKSQIRATEKTVVERLPVRIAIREKVALEMPHVMVLINDKKDTLMKVLTKATEAKSPLYDFTLMENSGAISGWFLQDPELLDSVAEELLKLKAEAVDGMLYAVGDGNHSLAAAKAHWENVKKKLKEKAMGGALSKVELADALANHPARFALVELVNLYDEALTFEPIHRLLMGVKKDANGVSNIEKDLGFDAKNAPNLQDLQPKIDAWMKEHPEVTIEYIHGYDTCLELGKKPENLAITWDEFKKDGLYKDVAEHGVLCRKSFSMGQAPDKRFYLELRKII